MNKDSFLKELERLLADIQESERKEAIEYYRDYFEEAGPENEQQVIMDLGSPGKVADIIKMSLNENGSAFGEFSERGYKDPRFEINYEVMGKEKNQKSEEGYGSHSNQYSGSYNGNNGYNSKRKAVKQRSAGEIVLLIVLAILALPIGVPVVITIISVLFAGVAVAFSLLIAAVAIGVGFLVGGVCTFIAGVVHLFMTPVAGIAAMGVGLILAGVGAFFCWLVVLLCIKVVPSLFTGTINLISRPFQRKG